jgi:hypothetical protein
VSAASPGRGAAHPLTQRASSGGGRVSLVTLVGELAQPQAVAVAESLRSSGGRRFAPPPPLLRLPLARPRPPVRTFAAVGAVHPLSAELSAAIRESAAGLGVTPYVYLFAAIAPLLGNLSGQKGQVIAVPTYRHPRVAWPLVRYFVKLILLRCRLENLTVFASLVQSVRNDLLAALEHRAYPLSQLMERLGITDKARPPLMAPIHPHGAGCAVSSGPGRGASRFSSTDHRLGQRACPACRANAQPPVETARDSCSQAGSGKTARPI